MNIFKHIGIIFILVASFSVSSFGAAREDEEIPPSSIQVVPGSHSPLATEPKDLLGQRIFGLPRELIERVFFFMDRPTLKSFRESGNQEMFRIATKHLFGKKGPFICMSNLNKKNFEEFSQLIQNWNNPSMKFGVFHLDPLVDVLKKLPSPSFLRIKSLEIRGIFWEGPHLSGLLKFFTNLESLKLIGSPLSEDCGQAILETCPKISKLILQGPDYSFGLATGSLKLCMLKKLKYLDLSGQFIHKTSVEQLITHLGNRLEYLNLRNNNFTEDQKEEYKKDPRLSKVKKYF